MSIIHATTAKRKPTTVEYATGDERPPKRQKTGFSVAHGRKFTFDLPCLQRGGKTSNTVTGIFREQVIPPSDDEEFSPEFNDEDDEEDAKGVNMYMETRRLSPALHAKLINKAPVRYLRGVEEWVHAVSKYGIYGTGSCGFDHKEWEKALAIMRKAAEDVSKVLTPFNV